MIYWSWPNLTHAYSALELLLLSRMLHMGQIRRRRARARCAAVVPLCVCVTVCHLVPHRSGGATSTRVADIALPAVPVRRNSALQQLGRGPAKQPPADRHFRRELTQPDRRERPNRRRRDGVRDGMVEAVALDGGRRGGRPRAGGQK